ncbi:uncharacterized protein [Haliotis asinina]|uniref:uncharacterized protein n=1 Tax=Haliotis asinina TaxID=109174 RepID=UPI003532277F
MAWDTYQRWLFLLCILHLIFCKTASGNWSDWAQWSEGPCGVTCGMGKREVTRGRFCQDASNSCAGPRVDKKIVDCMSDVQCGELECYECNVFRNGKITPCSEPKVVQGCKACMKSFTLVRLHDRLGYTKDSIVESRLCVRMTDAKKVSEEGCHYRTSNGGFGSLCYCHTGKCNSGMQQGASFGLTVLLGCAWSLCKVFVFDY